MYGSYLNKHYSIARNMEFIMDENENEHVMRINEYVKEK